jgi:hypothetical protein
VLRAVAVAAVVGSLFAAVATAAEAPTRDEYVTQLEQVCKPEAIATERAMKGARADVRRERFPIATAKFAQAKVIFGRTVDQIEKVPRPTADASRLRRWFALLRRQQQYLGEIGNALRARKGIQAQRFIARFIHTGNLANNVVLALGFNYCSFKFSRYG